MKLRLKRDIVIPAGTLFKTAPSEIMLDSDSHAEAIIGLSKDTAGSLIYSVGSAGSLERKQLRRWFEEIDEPSTRRTLS